MNDPYDPSGSKERELRREKDSDKELCERFLAGFDEPLNEEFKLQIARHTIRALISRIDLLEKQILETHRMASSAFHRTRRY